MTKGEKKLVAMLRPDAAVNCVPRRSDLPKGARFGIECSPHGSLAARVGVYRFASSNEAAFAYMTRMASAGVDVRSGDCNRDKPGEEPWVPGDGEANYDDPGVFNWENEALMPERIGCFLNDDGIANVRVACGYDYIGVLGTGRDLSDLTDWTWKYPKGTEHSDPRAARHLRQRQLAARQPEERDQTYRTSGSHSSFPLPSVSSTASNPLRS